MANYAPTTWATGDTITSTKLNNLENGLNNLTVAGTANQVLVNGATTAVNNAAITLTLPQSIATGSSPTFAGLTLSADTNVGSVNLGVGVATDSTVRLNIGQPTDGSLAIQTTTISAGSGSIWRARAARNTLASPSIVQNLDALLQLSAYGYDGAAYQPAAAIFMQVAAAPGAGDMPGKIVFQTTPDASSTLRTVTTLTSDRALMMFNGDNSDPAASANNAGIFAKDVSSSAELFGIDEAGNKPQLTPHNFTLFEPDQSYEYPWSYYCANDYLGVEIGVDMFGAIRALEALTGKQFIHLRNLPQKRDWNADQQARVTKRDAEIADAEAFNATLPQRKAARLTEIAEAEAFNAAVPKDKQLKVPEPIEDAMREAPKPYLAKVPPKWLADRLN